MPLALLQSLANEGIVALQIDKADCRPVAAQTVAVRLLERRASQDRRLAIIQEGIDVVPQRREPRVAVFVGQRNSLPHFVYIGLGMKIVTVIERPAEVLKIGRASCREGR